MRHIPHNEPLQLDCYGLNIYKEVASIFTRILGQRSTTKVPCFIAFVTYEVLERGTIFNWEYIISARSLGSCLSLARSKDLCCCLYYLCLGILEHFHSVLKEVEHDTLETQYNCGIHTCGSIGQRKNFVEYNKNIFEGKR